MHIVVLAATLVALLCLPCIVAAIVCADDMLDRSVRARGRTRETRALHRLDRNLDNDAPAPEPRPGRGPGIEQLAHDLRRLNRQRHGGIATGSQVWLAAVDRAYDDRLSLASRCLGVPEHLLPLQGMDRELERMRVEAELQAAGLSLDQAARRPPDRLP